MIETEEDLARCQELVNRRWERKVQLQAKKRFFGLNRAERKELAHVKKEYRALLLTVMDFKRGNE